MAMGDDVGLGAPRPSGARRGGDGDEARCVEAVSHSGGGAALGTGAGVGAERRRAWGGSSREEVTTRAVRRGSSAGDVEAGRWGSPAPDPDRVREEGARGESGEDRGEWWG